ncbi:hypothetical protein N7510_005447 [Penicillium lagena]|uniref:uncharacterized protein n=1 Tax=Penicillium lagena TaxID=94218 RepID=UPI00254189FA|nr:uncharacterized protein N7510_005447 [Penicillium lagena]KAJ5612253.1 hypothetical protein N7510_005447 [Penicillium lagena]
MFPKWMRPNMKPAEKHFRCTVCQRAFTRIDHLKRHHLRHSGQKPYSCVFCNEAFARCDNLRDHYTDCVKRGDRKIPETGQRGRRRHACQSCMSMKLRCDGQSPCGSCQKRNLECNNEQPEPSKQPELDYSEPSVKSEVPGQPSDRGSIKFLLNAGYNSFTEGFRLPPRSDRPRGALFDSNQNELEESENSMFPYNMESGQTNYTPAMLDSDPTALQFYQDTFLDFFNGPFGDAHKIQGDPYSGVAYQAIGPPGQDPSLALSGENAMFEPERPFSAALIQSILARAWTLPLDAKAQEEISTSLNFLLTTARIRKFVALYFKYWHPSCKMIHRPSFDPETATLPLLASVVFMGAMYATDQGEAYVAKRVLDFAELFIFSCDVYSAENDIVNVFSGNRCFENESNDWVKFQNFQAGFLITIVQYWAGSKVSRSRAMENRFSEVVKVTRRLRLLKCRHTPRDRVLESLWIQTECRIRCVNIVISLDCAFFFYQNHPCRFTHTEMECDLPCYDSLFRSDHPFREPNFRYTRDLTISEAFQNLFEEEPGRDSPPHSPGINRMDLTVLDMWSLIHILYAFINTHMTLLGPRIRHRKPEQNGNYAASGTNPINSMPDDSVLKAIRTALSQWHNNWEALRSKLSGEEWASMGFYKNGYNFWLVSQLLMTKKDAVDVVMNMEVNCEDKLQKLKVLLRDEKE